MNKAFYYIFIGFILLIPQIVLLCIYYFFNIPINNQSALWTNIGLFAYYAVTTAVIASIIADLFNKTSHDDLTGILNFETFFATLQKELQRSERNNQSISLSFLDIDNFSRVNQEYGHYEGSEILKKVCRVIESNIRPYDIFGRVGGDEFAIIFPNTSEEKAAQVLERIEQEVEKQFIEKHITISCGVGEYSRRQDAKRLYSKANAKMYQKKEIKKLADDKINT